MKFFIFLVIAVKIISYYQVESTCNNSNLNVPTISNTFISPERANFLSPRSVAMDWDDELWRLQMTEMKNAGLTNISLIYVADLEPKDTVGSLPLVYYPTRVQGFTRAVSILGKPVDLIGNALKFGRMLGMKVWIGLQNCGSLGGTSDKVWLQKQADLMEQLSSDIWTLYASDRDIIAGWYIPFELNHLAWDIQARIPVTDFLQRSVLQLHTLSNGLPVMISPFFNDKAGVSINQWKETWTSILSCVPIDVIALQDGVGDINEFMTKEVTLPRLAAWFGALRDAIKASGRRTALWANTDLYRAYHGGQALTSDLVQCMAAVRPFVSAYTSFSYNNHLSSVSSPSFGKFYKSYQYYRQHGYIAQGIVTIPTDVIAGPLTGTNLLISWKPSTSSTGLEIAYYRIYRVQGAVRQYVDMVYTSPWTAKDIKPNTPYHYEIVGFDAAGNKSPAATVTNMGG